MRAKILDVDAMLLGVDGPLDLSQQAVLKHFAESTQSAHLLTFLLSLDSVDRWAVDFNEGQSATAFEVQLFLQEFQRFVETSVTVLHRIPKELAAILAHLTTSRCMYVIRYAGQHNDGFSEQFSVLLEQEAGASVDVAALKRRLEAFSKAQLLGAVFSGQRLDRIMKIMGSYSHV